MTLGPERSTLWADNATYVLFPDTEYRQNSKLVERVSSQVQNRCHLLCIAGMFNNRPRSPYTTLITTMVITEFIFHLVAESNGWVDVAWP